MVHIPNTVSARSVINSDKFYCHTSSNGKTIGYVKRSPSRRYENTQKMHAKENVDENGARLGMPPNKPLA